MYALRMHDFDTVSDTVQILCKMSRKLQLFESKCETVV